MPLFFHQVSLLNQFGDQPEDRFLRITDSLKDHPGVEFFFHRFVLENAELSEKQEHRPDVDRITFCELVFPLGPNRVKLLKFSRKFGKNDFTLADDCTFLCHDLLWLDVSVHQRRDSGSEHFFDVVGQFEGTAGFQVDEAWLAKGTNDSVDERPEQKNLGGVVHVLQPLFVIHKVFEQKAFNLASHILRIVESAELAFDLTAFEVVFLNQVHFVLYLVGFEVDVKFLMAVSGKKAR